MITRLKLANWKSHLNSEYAFSKGTNILVGPMGAGKTSVLQAISYALFGTFYELKSREIKTTDVINRASNAAFAEVELATHDFSIHRKIDERGAEASLRDLSGKLIAGINPTQVNDYVEQVLKINDDIFLRTVYARQNDIDLFLKISPGERKKKLDEIMGLDKFETVRKNAKTLLNSIEKTRKDKDNYFKSLDVENLDSAINGLSSDIQRMQQAEKDAIQFLLAAKAQKVEAERSLKSLRKACEEYSRIEAERDFKSKQIQELEHRLAGSPEEMPERIGESLAEIKLKISEMQKMRQAVSDDLRKQGRQSMEIERELGSIEARYTEAGRRISEAEGIGKKIDSAAMEFGGTAALVSKVVEYFERLRILESELQQCDAEIIILEKHLNELEGADSVCPMCSQKLEAVTKEGLLFERKSKIAELKSKSYKLKTESDSLRSETEKLQKARDNVNVLSAHAGSLEELRASEKAIFENLSLLKGKRLGLEAASENLGARLNEIESQISGLEIEHSKLLEQRHVFELRAQKSDLAEEFNQLQLELGKRKAPTSELEKSEQEFQRLLSEVGALESRQESDRAVISEKTKRLDDLQQRRKQATDLAAEISKLQGKVEFLQQFTNALLAAQETLRKELIVAVNEVMSGIWQQIYPYQKWISAQLEPSSEDYVLKLKDADGNFVSVAGFASGGERMLASLALRIAFAKVMAPNLNILILDEPTHNLDEKAISTFVDLLRERSLGFLDQVFIVTHEERLAEAGDNVIRLNG